jgi:hypothetical protein
MLVERSKKQNQEVEMMIKRNRELSFGGQDSSLVFPKVEAKIKMNYA